MLDWRPLTHKRTGSVDAFENCELAAWLSEDFANAAFSHFERLLVVGVPTLLSTEELERLLPTEESRMCKATAYAISRGADGERHESWGGCTRYWTKSRSDSRYDFAWDIIQSFGRLFPSWPTGSACGVRPAIRMEIQA